MVIHYVIIITDDIIIITIIIITIIIIIIIIITIIIIIITFILTREIGFTELLLNWKASTGPNSAQLLFLYVITQTLETVNVDLKFRVAGTAKHSLPNQIGKTFSKFVHSFFNYELALEGGRT